MNFDIIIFKAFYFINRSCNICIEIPSFLCYEVYRINQNKFFTKVNMWLWKILRLKLLPVAWVGIPTAPAWLTTYILIKVLLVLIVCLIESKFCVGLWLTLIRLSSTLFLLLNYLGKKKKIKPSKPNSTMDKFVEAYPG